MRTCGSDNTISSNTPKMTAKPSLQAGKARASIRARRLSPARPLRPQLWHAGSVDFLQATEARALEVRVIWEPPFYPIIEEPLPDLEPLTRAKWVDEQ